MAIVSGGVGERCCARREREEVREGDVEGVDEVDDCCPLSAPTGHRHGHRGSHMPSTWRPRPDTVSHDAARPPWARVREEMGKAE